MQVTRVLFLCVHNSARSQMAEALLRHLGGDRFIVESAGFELAELNPLAVAAMDELDIDISAAQPKAVFDLFRAGRRYDYVISLADESTGERCPIFPGFTKRLSWNFADPVSFQGSLTERQEQANHLRDAIRERLGQWLAALEGAGN